MGRRRQERTWSWWPGGRGRTLRLLCLSCLQLPGASPGGGRGQLLSSACGTKVEEMLFQAEGRRMEEEHMVTGRTVPFTEHH